MWSHIHAHELSLEMGGINASAIWVALMSFLYSCLRWGTLLSDALWACGVWGSQRGQWQGRRGTRQGRRATLAQQDGHWGLSLWVTLMNFFVLVVCKFYIYLITHIILLVGLVVFHVSHTNL